MSSEDKSRKTEEPTPHKLRKARERGQIPKSREVVSVACLIVTLGVVALASGYIADQVFDLTHAVLSAAGQPFDRAAKQALLSFTHTVIDASLPAVATALVVVIAASIAQFGFIFAVEPIKPDFNKINPVEGAKKLFGRKKLIEIAKAVIKITVIGLVAALVVRAHLDDLGNIVYCGLDCGVQVAWIMVLQMLLGVVPIFIILAVIDYRFQRAEFMRDQRMTKEEVKREHKDTEGSPELRQERRSRQREQVSDDLRSKITQATALVSDGSRRVFAVYYDEKTTPLPLLSVREQGGQARRIVVIAERHARPVFVDEALARLLWKHGKADHPIPKEAFDAVAEIIIKARQRGAQENGA